MIRILFFVPLYPPYNVTQSITNTSMPQVGDILRVHATQQSDAHNIIVTDMQRDGIQIARDCVPPGNSEDGDCGAAYTTPSGSHIAGIHCEGHPASSPNHSIRMIRMSKFSFSDGNKLELFPDAAHRLYTLGIPVIASVVVVLFCALLVQYYFPR